ncbi:metallophosphoesterase [Verrucomicrobiales bacterium BCK34]|nr:metallophosphoesterase [Verrucomicrobiales bacterium BCK34]
MENNIKQQWDLIGDIHGRYASLVRLLEELGYESDREGGGFRHPEGRKVIFVGDFIDRGPNSFDVVSLAKRMVENGQALAVMGNHEFNFVSYMTPDDNGGYLRERSEKNTKLVRETLQSFRGRESALADAVEWMKALPFFLELDGLRVVHASWVPEDIDFLRESSLEDEAFLSAANRKGTREYEAIEHVLKGIEAPLPDGITLPDANGIERDSLRVKWWENLDGKSWRAIAFPPREDLSEEVAAFKEGAGVAGVYPADAPPLFIGHYKLLNYEPFAATANIASLDYGLGHGGDATAYRWRGETRIEVGNFVQVSEEADVKSQVSVDDQFHCLSEVSEGGTVEE